MPYVVKCKAARLQAFIQVPQKSFRELFCEEGNGLESERLALEVLDMWQELRDKGGCAVAWHLLSAARSVTGSGDLMTPLQKALELYRELQWRRYEATALYNLSERQRFQPHGGPVAQRTAEEAVSIWKEIGNFKGEATALTAVAKAMILRGLKAARALEIL